MRLHKMKFQVLPLYASSYSVCPKDAKIQVCPKKHCAIPYYLVRVFWRALHFCCSWCINNNKNFPRFFFPFITVQYLYTFCSFLTHKTLQRRRKRKNPIENVTIYTESSFIYIQRVSFFCLYHFLYNKFYKIQQQQERKLWSQLL